MNIIGFIFSFLASLFAGISMYDTKHLVVRRYRLKNKKINKNIRVVMLSDLHGCEYGENNSYLIERVKKLSPDVIIIAGDMINAKFSFKYNEAYSLIKELSHIATVYYGIGNHEARLLWDEKYGLNYDKFIDELTASSAVVIDNDECYLDDFRICIKGLSLPRMYYKKNIKVNLTKDTLNELIGTADNNDFNIVVAHNPEYFKSYCDYRADLVLSGHLHGGIMKLPNGRGFISPRFKLFPKYCGGRFVKSNTTMIVGRGLGQHTLPFRVFNPCEIVLIELGN